MNTPRKLSGMLMLLMLCATRGGLADVKWPSPEWESVELSETRLDFSLLEKARNYSLSAGGSGMIIHNGRVMLRWGDQDKRYDIKSATKSFGATMLGVALKDGKINLNALAHSYHPTIGTPPESNVDTGWLQNITIMNLATQTAGFDKPGGYEKLLFEPGTCWHYSDGGPNWLAECITLQYRRDLEDVLFERVLIPIGISHDDLHWRDNRYREKSIEGIPRREFGAGIQANVEALSRFGYLYLREGRWRDREIITKDFVRMAGHSIQSLRGLPEWDPDSYGNASDHYGLLWWNNSDGTLARVPRDAYWAWGLYDSLVVVIPSLDLVVVRGGESKKSWPRKKGETHCHVLEPFLEPIVSAVESAHHASGPAKKIKPDHVAPYPRSSVITGIDWAPPETIVRMAKGSDNWPLTWADDNHLYTAYGDGWGFKPFTEEKLSLGLARIEGKPDQIMGFNIRSSSIEQSGPGERGMKASGILMVDGVLYLWVRNAGNAQLAWSIDHGSNWKWADWKLDSSFGAPTFLNFGRNYAGARDEFVYLYSHDSDSAYEAADRMVMARVRRDQLKNRDAYEFFQELDSRGNPIWTREIERRGAVFTHTGNCYRSGITYSPGLNRYLWCQVLPQSKHPRGQRFQGGFGIYEAPEPWGPWFTVFFTKDWDVGPGETSSFPVKWMSKDGKYMYLVFSGDDHFSIRKAVLTR